MGELETINSKMIKKRKIGIEGLFYITHIHNVPSILMEGILSHSQILQSQTAYTPIYNTNIVRNRSQRIVYKDKTLWNFANLYFQPRNAMLYSLIHQDNDNLPYLAILSIKTSILTNSNIFVTTGNAASYDSEIKSLAENKTILTQIRKQIDREWWSREDGSKRTMMAECLVPQKVEPQYIQSIYVGSEKGKNNLEAELLNCKVNHNIPIVIEREKFFQAAWRKAITKQLFLVKGDMFFSQMQTLTISVNCVGVMGKGLASTAKYRFPDVYVKYQSICKQKEIELGKPYLYKRESSTFYDLYDENLSLENLKNNTQTWFLLFPTKNHWRNKSTLASIETGLQWLVKHFHNLGIKSLALPALGCGLGQLSWQDVGPLMCKYLVRLNIPVALYLPTEQELPPEWVSTDFLLSQIDF